MNIHGRAEWRAKPPTKPLARWKLVNAGVQHWQGGYADPLLLVTDDQKIAHMLQEQRSAQAGEHGDVYSDAPYNHYVFPDGSIWEGRGWDYQSGANGKGTSYNAHAPSLQYVAGRTEDRSRVTPLTDAAKASMLWYWQEAARRFPSLAHVYSHGEVRKGGTECPGTAVVAFLPTINEQLHAASGDDDDMPLNDADKKWIYEAIVEVVRKEGISKNAQQAAVEASKAAKKLGV